jgi:hypothetical protein
VKSYNLHANCYVTKPVRLNQFFQVVKNIEEFWFNIVKLLPRTRTSRAGSTQRENNVLEILLIEDT